MFDITIAGEINLDLILYGLPQHMPVEVELLATDFQMTLGSSSAILAHNLATLGAKVGFATRVGTDQLGCIALARLKESGADVSHAVFDSARPTGVTVLLHHGGERHILTYPGNIGDMTVSDLDMDYLRSSRHFHLSSLFLLRGLAPALPKMFRELRKAGLTISLDTNDDPENQWGGVLDELLDCIDILLPNETEACRIARCGALDEALATLSHRIPCVAVKCGPRGSIVQANGKRTMIPQVMVSPVDLIGAGDSFNAGFLFAWLQGLSPELCAMAGNITGALSTLRPGGTEAFRDKPLTDTFLRRHGFPPREGPTHPEIACRGEEPQTVQLADDDKFVAMVTAKAAVSLPLSDFNPKPMLVTREHRIERPRFPVIDYHNHLDAFEPHDVLRIMDACGVERIVNITMKVGEDALRIIDKFRLVDPVRFATIGWMDWSGIEKPGFIQGTCDWLERLAERGVQGIKFWKDLGLSVRDGEGRLLRIDDERLAPIFDKAGELGFPVMFHTADPDAFFLPVDESNERYEELAAHPDWSFWGSKYAKRDLLDQRDQVIARHPKTTFVAAHVAESSENLDRVTRLLETHPNAYIDISARTPELGRQPYTARKFFLRFADRILFGTDLLPDEKMYRLYFRFLETADEYFEYPSHASRQGRWNIYGLNLPDDVLCKVYRENAQRLLRQ